MNLNEPRPLDRRVRDNADLSAGIIGSAMDAIIAVDDAQRIVLFNAAAERIFVCPANEAIGGSVERFIPQRFRAGLSTRVHRFAESGITNRTLRGMGKLWGLRATGEEFPIEASISKVESGGKEFFTVVIRDLTERQRAEEALRASEERLRLAQQAARIGTFEWNIQTGVNTWTPELEAMYGLPPGGFGATQFAFESLVHPDDRAGVIELKDCSLKTGQPTTGEWRVVWADGSVHWIVGRWQVFMNESGEPSRMVGINIDITERRRTEQELATANERLHLAMESGSVGGWDYDVKTGKTVLFGMAHAQLGVSPDETSGSRQEFWDRVHAGDRERYLSAIAAAREKKEHFDGEFRVVWRDGTIRWLRTRGRYYYAADGEPERLLGISIDITERKHAEQLLRESEQRLRLATQAGRMYAYDWDITADVVVRSSEHVKILGLTEPLRFPHQEFMDKIHPDDRPRFLATIAGLTPENPTGEVTYRLLASDGAFAWLKSNGHGFFDAEGKMLRVIGMVADVTDQKLAEEALRTSEELLKTFVKNVPAAVAMLDRDMRYLQVSERWSNDYLHGKAQILGRSHYEVFPDMPDRWKEVHRRALQGETLRAEEDRWDGQDGTHWARWEVRPWKSAEGTVGGILILTEDITRRKQMEEALSDMSRKLIESQEQERARIARELHDDINQRLALVAIGLDQLQEKHKDLPSEVRGHVQELQQMTSDISSSVYALSHELYSSIPDSLGLARGMKSWCRDFGERQQMKIDFKGHDLPRLPQEISSCLFRVLQEAVHNAAKHSGVKRVEAQLQEESGEIHLIVSDSGRGFDVEVVSKGMGLGLIGMRGRVRLVNGTISIESKPMGGTTIHACVPFESQQGAQRAAG